MDYSYAYIQHPSNISSLKLILYLEGEGGGLTVNFADDKVTFAHGTQNLEFMLQRLSTLLLSMGYEHTFFFKQNIVCNFNIYT